jgi:aminocarboxymuconate-semialdehyde decarboxylase
MIDDKVNGRTYDDPSFLPLWKAAEQMGALMFIHQGGATLVRERTDRYHLPNTIGNLVDRAVTFASFVFGGVMDQSLLSKSFGPRGGYTCWHWRMDPRGGRTAPAPSRLHQSANFAKFTMTA